MSAAVVKQLGAALICAQTFVILGGAVGSGSVLFAQETSESAPGERRSAGGLSVAQVTWIVSSFTFGNIPGTLASMWLSPRVGAPRLLLASLPLVLAGAAMIGLGPTFAWTLAGRLLVGLYFGIVEGPARAYVGEVTGREVRGLIGNILNIVTPVCIVVVLGLGSRLPWRTVEFALETTAAIVQAVGLFFLPRSPKWLLAHGHSREEAEHALRFFHGPDFDIKQAVRDIEGSLAAHSHKPASSGVLGGLALVFTRWENLHPTLLLLVQFFCMVFTGGMGVAQFAPTVFRLTGQDVNPFYSSVYVTAAMSLAFLISGPLLERCNRVLLLQLGGLLGMAGCTAIGVYFWQISGVVISEVSDVVSSELISSEVGDVFTAAANEVSDVAGASPGGNAWLVLVGALAIVLSYGASIAPVTFTYLVELLPNSTRAFTINVVLLYFSLVQFCVVHFFPAMERGLGDHGTFWLFAAVNVLQVLLATFALPETRGLSLEEIQHRFFAGKRRPSTDDQPGSETVVTGAGGDVERGQVNAALETEEESVEEEGRKKEPGRLEIVRSDDGRSPGRLEIVRSDDGRRSTGRLEIVRSEDGRKSDRSARGRSEDERRRSAESDMETVYPAGCFV